MHKYRISDDAISEIIEAENDADAEEQAAESWKAGSWDSKCLVSLYIEELGDDGQPFDGATCWHIDVECGEDPEPPECSSDEGHDWVSPVEVVGGLKENPGVWSTGGTTITSKDVCRHCGIYRKQVNYGSQRKPGQCDSVEYLPADESSVAWLESVAAD